jgi:hypothetical protein
MGIHETNSLFLSLHHWAAIAASALFAAEAIMLGLAMSGGSARRRAAEAAEA